MKLHKVILNFNRGIISRLGFARQDIERLSLSAERQNNFFPRVLGSMRLRTGLKYTGSTYNNNYAVHYQFIYKRSDQATLEFTDSNLRVKINDIPITRGSVSSLVTNGYFTTDLTGWTDVDETGCVSVWKTGGYLSLTGTGFNYAKRRQQIAVSGGDVNTAHSLRIVVNRGVSTVSIGASSGGGEYLNRLVLKEGAHSLKFTPTGDFHIEISSNTEYETLIDSCVVESSGDLLLPTVYAESDLDNLRFDQSGDVVYVACAGYEPYKIIRYGTESWGVQKLNITDGPFRIINTSNITISSSGLSGDVTLTSSRQFFNSKHVGSLFKIASSGQSVSKSINGENQFTDSIKVTGVGGERIFDVIVSGTWTATLTLQRSYDDGSTWSDVQTYTTNNFTDNFDDQKDNQIILYRVGVKTGDYTSGTINVNMSYGRGSISGIVKVTSYVSETSVEGIVLSPLGSTAASDSWYEGEWSEYRGFPSAVALHEGRLVFGGLGKLFFSISDVYESFDGSDEGDSSAFTKSIPSGAVDSVNWLLSLKRLLVGTESDEWYVRSSSYDEALTPSNANLKRTSNLGSNKVQAKGIDNVAIFAHSSGKRSYKTGYTIESDDFRTDDVSKLVPELLEQNIVKTAVQRIPDTRVHHVLGDGSVAIYLHDTLEDVKSWFTFTTDGEVEDIFASPASDEDLVYYCVKRNINGSDVRYLEKFSFESECVGGVLNKQADSFIEYSGAATDTITGLDNLEGKEVIVWADGKDLSADDSNGVQKTYTVIGGQITLDESVSSAVIGLPYTAQYKTVKLAYPTSKGTSLLQHSRVNKIGIVAVDMHSKGLTYGSDFSELDELPLIEDCSPIGYDTIHSEYDNEMFEFDGDWDTDPRVCLQAKAPRPCNILAVVTAIEFHEMDDLD